MQHHYAEAFPSHGAVFSEHCHFHVSHDERSHSVRVLPGLLCRRLDSNQRQKPDICLAPLYPTELRLHITTAHRFPYRLFVPVRPFPGPLARCAQYRRRIEGRKSDDWENSWMTMSYHPLYLLYHIIKWNLCQLFQQIRNIWQCHAKTVLSSC